MKALFIKRILVFGILVFLFNSCSSNLDFNQVNTLKVEPVVVSNLASFEILANQFDMNGVEQSSIAASSNFDIFSDPNFANHLLKADFNFEIMNSINRGFSIDIVLLDANDNPLYTIISGVPASSSSFKFTETFSGSKLSLLEQTRKIAFAIHLNPGIPTLTSSSLGSLKLRSGITAYLKIK